MKKDPMIRQDGGWSHRDSVAHATREQDAQEQARQAAIAAANRELADAQKANGPTQVDGPDGSGGTVNPMAQSFARKPGE